MVNHAESSISAGFVAVLIGIASSQNPEVLIANRFRFVGEPSFNDTAPVGFTFYGIKYGLANRFQDAVVNSDHSYLASVTSSNRKGPMCLQTANTPPWNSTGITEFSKDCLYLDIHVPPTWTSAQNTKKIPVFFLAWGGKLLSSSRGFPGAGANLAKALNIIVVIPQFRVGVFGFFSTGNSAAYGNYALSDMKTAFYFVHQNIGYFNGDNQKVTISGQSDGAALTSSLLLDRNLASRVFGAVTMSGSILSQWAIDETPLIKAVGLAATANCLTSTTIALVACLKRIQGSALQLLTEQFFNASQHAPLRNGVPTWSMVIDKKHIPADPALLLKSQTRRGLVNGFVHQYNKQDASIVALRAFGTNIVGAGRPTLAFLKRIAIPLVIQQATLCTSLSNATIDLVAATYGMTAPADPLTLRNALFQLTTDVNHRLSNVKEAMLYSETAATRVGNSVSVLAFDADISSHSPLANFVFGAGAYHTVDVGYLFDGTMSPLLAGQSDAEVTRVFRQQFNEVITCGRGLGQSFDPVQQNYIELGQDRTWCNQLFQRTVQLVNFWDQLKALRCAPPPPNASL